MKDYKRLTKRNNEGGVNYFEPLISTLIGAIFEECKSKDTEIIYRLSELEDKIESGELISPNDVGEKEIEFFAKHNEKIRKETASECAKIVDGYLGADPISNKIRFIFGLEEDK